MTKAACEYDGFETCILDVKCLYCSTIGEPVDRPFQVTEFLQLLVAVSSEFRAFERFVLSFSTKRNRLHLGKVNSRLSLLA